MIEEVPVCVGGSVSVRANDALDLIIDEVALAVDC